MDGRIRECPLCLTRSIRPSIDPHYRLHNKSICVSCRTLLISQVPKPPSLPSPISQVPIFLPSTLDYSRCITHGEVMKWVCEMCEEPGCSGCLNEHPERTYEPMADCIEKRLKTLHFTEYLARWLELKKPEDERVREVREGVQRFYRESLTKQAWETYLHMGIAANGFFVQLQSMCEDFQAHSVEECVNMVLQRPLSGSVDTDWFTRTMAWSHWSQHSIYFLDLESRAKERLELSSEFAVPLFSRTIILPDGDLFLCGGRTEANGFSLNSCWKIERSGSKVVKRMPDLLYGRSNHWALYYKQKVYVIAGCDQNNKFTNKCERFSLAANAWEHIAGTNETRDSISAVCDSRFDCIYTAGGRIDNGVLANTIERYDISRNLWVAFRLRMPFSAYMQGVALLPGNETKLLVFGGLNLGAQPIRRTCLVDLNKEEAVEIQAMVGDGGCVVDTIQVYAGYVYAFCFSGFAVRTWERWSIDFQCWESLPSFRAD